MREKQLARRAHRGVMFFVVAGSYWEWSALADSRFLIFTFVGLLCLGCLLLVSMDIKSLASLRQWWIEWRASPYARPNFFLCFCFGVGNYLYVCPQREGWKSVMIGLLSFICSRWSSVCFQRRGNVSMASVSDLAAIIFGLITLGAIGDAAAGR